MKRDISIMSIILALLFAFPTFAGETGEDYVQVYYFHGDFRCETCRSIEKMSKEVVHERFSDDLKEGHLKWEIINFEKDGNEKYIDRFELFNQSLVLVKVENGRRIKWKSCDKIWEHVRDERKFKDYVQTEIEKYL